MAAPMKPTKTHFGALVRRYREGRAWSQTELGERIGVAKSTAMDMEIGPVRSRPIEQILKLVELFDVPLAVWADALKQDGIDVVYITDTKAWPVDVIEMASHATRLPPDVREMLLEQARALDKRYGQDQEPGVPAEGPSSGE